MIKLMKKYNFQNLILVLISIIFTLGIIEIGLRILFSSDHSFLVEQYQDREFLVSNKYWGIWHYPNNKVHHKRDCFDAIYKTNSYGMKSPEMKEIKSNFRVAFLGDSYIEGHGKSNNKILTYYFDSLSNSSVEVMNFGTSGGFGTVDEVVLYENFVSFLKPDLTVLFFLNYNDLYDNLKSVESGLVNDKGDFLNQKSQSFEETYSEIWSHGEAKKSFKGGVNGLYVISLASRGLMSLSNFFQYVINIKFDFRTAIAQVYVDEETDRIKQGYFLFEKAIIRLDSLTKVDSSKLLVVNFADPFQTDANWLKFNEKKLNKKLIPDLPNKKIKQICDENGIAYYDMYPETIKEINEKEMKYPYFFHSCDRHLSSTGNQFMAQLLYNYLKKEELIGI